MLLVAAAALAQAAPYEVGACSPSVAASAYESHASNLPVFLEYDKEGDSSATTFLLKVRSQRAAVVLRRRRSGGGGGGGWVLGSWVLGGLACCAARLPARRLRRAQLLEALRCPVKQPWLQSSCGAAAGG